MNENISEKINEVGAEARKRAQDGFRAARHQVKAARRQVEERTQQLRDGYSQVQDSVTHVSHDLSDFVRQSPGRSVLIAAGAGFLLGLLFRGRR